MNVPLGPSVVSPKFVAYAIVIASPDGVGMLSGLLATTVS